MTEPERLEALIAAVNHQTSAIEGMQQVLQQVLIQMREPASSELPDLIRALVAQSQNMNVAMIAHTKSVDGLGGTVTQMGARISELRDAVVRATSGG